MPVTLSVFPVQVPSKFRGYRVGAHGKTCYPDKESGWRPRFWDSFLAPRGQFKHHATDIVAAEGTPSRSTTAGSVMREWRGLPGAGYSEKGGWYVWIRDPDGNEHYYSHLQKRPKVRPGQPVTAGQVIGYVGRTGNAIHTCPHLHYAITSPYKRKINPYPLLKPFYDAGGWRFEDIAPAAAGGLVLLLALGAGGWILWRQFSR